jgi:hypothetical protein
MIGITSNNNVIDLVFVHWLEFNKHLVIAKEIKKFSDR